MTDLTQLLHYQYQDPSALNNQKDTNIPTLVFIHGLFGDMNNLGVVARAFQEQYPILRVDLRNHGASFHSDQMDYPLMATDLLKLLDHLMIKKAILIGHSMGGKTAMMAASMRPELIEKIVVIDIAPIAYQGNRHNDVFAGLFAVQNAQVADRQTAKPLLSEHIAEPAVQQFMLKSFDANSPSRFRFNLNGLKKNYENLMGWQKVHYKNPALFIKGGLSDYILPEHQQQILDQFPQAKAFTINGCGHWIHAEKPDFVVRAIERFLAN